MPYNTYMIKKEIKTLRKEKKMEIKKEWKTAGKTVTVTGKLITSKVNYCDGDNITVPCCEISINVDVEGVGGQGDWIKSLPAPIIKNEKTYVASMGRLGLTQEQVDIINSVKTAIEATPEWQAKLARIAQNKKDSEAYEKSYKRVEKMMNM